MNTLYIETINLIEKDMASRFFSVFYIRVLHLTENKLFVVLNSPKICIDSLASLIAGSRCYSELLLTARGCSRGCALYSGE
jgi:hypothetical protein